MQSIINNLEQVRQLSGNVQISYLQSIKSDLLYEILEYTYNPHKLYKIDEGKYDKIDEKTNAIRSNFDIDDWNNFKSKLDYLNSIKSAKDEDVRKITSFINDFDEPYKDFMKKVLFKDLRLNMGVKKFQKVFPGFCEEPQVQLANKWEGQTFPNGFYSRKLDGLRTYILDGVAYSRANKKHKEAPFQHIIEQISQLNNNTDYVFDGELIYLNPDGTEDFQKAISLARSDDRDILCDNLYFVVFDVINKQDFLTKRPSLIFDDEYIFLKGYLQPSKNCLSWFETKLPNILLINQVQEAEVETLKLACKENNWEGLMYRDGNASYEYKRTKSLLKIKEMQDIELKLVNMEEGTGKFQNTLGAFVVEYENNLVKIGSGFTDEQRAEYWNNKDKYIGNYVKIQYFEKTTNQDGGLSLRFPVFLCFRNIENNEEFLKF